MTICFLCYDLQERTTKVRLETMNAAGTSIASVEETSFEYDTGSIRIASVHKIDSTNDGTFETIRRTEYLTDHANPTGYSQVIMETETDANGNPIKRTVYTIGHDQISQTVYGPGIGGATWDSGTTHFFGTDGHGSVRVLYDTLAAVVTSAANVLQVFHYDAYGNLLNMAATSALTSYLYSGEAFDTRINLQYLRARWYDPQTGRFTSLDPFRGNTSDPQSLHKYLYVHGDPISGIDPSGQMVSFIAGASIALSFRSIYTQHTLNSGQAILDTLGVNWSIDPFDAVMRLAWSLLPSVFRNWVGGIFDKYPWTKFVAGGLVLAAGAGIGWGIRAYHSRIANQLTESQTRLAGQMAAITMRRRSEELISLVDKATKQRISLHEAIGGSRIEYYLGGKIREGGTEAYDFVHSSLGRVQLKGPAIDANGRIISNTKALDGILSQAKKAIETKEGFDTLVIDVFGFENIQEIQLAVISFRNRRNVPIYILY